MEINQITAQIIASAIKVHTVLGPGLLESAYETCLSHELQKRGVMARKQLALPIEYDGVLLDAGYRIDLMVEDRVIVELKAVGKMNPIFEAQLLSYLRLSKLQVGLLINFHVLRLKDGIKRIVNQYTGPTPRPSATSAVNRFNPTRSKLRRLYRN
jgi:GxxExxY protein